jgi:Major Facilitator Superfamily
MLDQMLEVELQKDINSTTDNSINDESMIDNNHLAADEKPVQNNLERTSISGNGEVADEKQLSPPEDVSPRDVHGWKWALVVTSILSSIFLFALDNTVVADIQPAIVETFGDVAKLPWLSVGFLLGAASTNLIWGKIYSQFNAKWAYVGCVLFFEVGSAICGGANNMTTLIIGRVLCGVSGSGMYVGVMTLLSVTTAIHERPMYVGSTGLMWGIGEQVLTPNKRRSVC